MTGHTSRDAQWLLDVIFTLELAMRALAVASCILAIIGFAFFLPRMSSLAYVYQSGFTGAQWAARPELEVNDTVERRGTV